MLTHPDLVALLSSGELIHRYTWILRKLRIPARVDEIISTLCIAPRPWSLSQLSAYIEASKSSTRNALDQLHAAGIVQSGEDGWFIDSATRSSIYALRHDIWLVSLGWKRGLAPATIAFAEKLNPIDRDLVVSIRFSAIMPAPESAEAL